MTDKPKLPRSEDGAYAGDMSPGEAWARLEADAKAVLIDVRTDAEFGYVGRPDLSKLGHEITLVQWVTFPDNGKNAGFVDEVAATGVTPENTIMFLCRSGVRSRYAAAAMTAAGYGDCHNVLEGFEGDKDPSGHRGTIGGWKVAGLPWVQG